MSPLINPPLITAAPETPSAGTDVISTIAADKADAIFFFKSILYLSFIKF